jgi:hypothetical protein
MKKAIEIQHQNLDTDSDESSDDEVFTSSKKKKKGKQPINIIVKNYGVPRERKNEYDASEHIAKLKDIYREPEPVAQPKIALGYFV